MKSSTYTTLTDLITGKTTIGDPWEILMSDICTGMDWDKTKEAYPTATEATLEVIIYKKPRMYACFSLPKVEHVYELLLAQDINPGIFAWCLLYYVIKESNIDVTVPTATLHTIEDDNGQRLFNTCMKKIQEMLEIFYD